MSARRGCLVRTPENAHASTASRASYWSAAVPRPGEAAECLGHKTPAETTALTAARGTERGRVKQRSPGHTPQALCYGAARRSG